MIHQIKTLNLAGRVTLSYVEQGDSTGINVIFLHGYTDSWHSFETVLPHIPKNIRAFVISQRGHGDSGRPATGYRIKDLSDDIALFIKTLNIGPAIIVGHCMGGYVAQRFAIDYPELTLGLVLVSSFTTVKYNPIISEVWQEVSILTDPIDFDFALTFQQSTIAKPIADTFLQIIVNESLKLPADIWRAVLAELKDTDHSRELNRIKAPTLILWGDQDTLITQSEQVALQAAIKTSQLLTYSGVGHALHWEEPIRFTLDLLVYIESHQFKTRQSFSAIAY